MKIMKNALLLGTGLTVGIIAGIEFTAQTLGYRFDHLEEGDKILIDKTNGFRVTVLASKKNSNIRLAAYEDLTSSLE